MKETKLEKVNERLYHQSDKGGRLTRWKRDLKQLYFGLTDLQLELILEIYRPGTARQLGNFDWEEFHPLQDIVRDERGGEKSDKTEAGHTTPENAKEPDDPLGLKTPSETSGWRLNGIGRLDRALIGVIRKDGSISQARSDQFNNISVELRPGRRWKEKEYDGLFHYIGASPGLSQTPEITISVNVPKAQIEKICHEILSGRLTVVRVEVLVELFEPVWDRNTWSPSGPRTYFVEEDSFWNGVYLCRLAASQTPKGGATTGGAVEGSLDDPSE